MSSRSRAQVVGLGTRCYPAPTPQLLSCFLQPSLFLPQPSFPFTIFSYTIFQFAKFSRTGTAFTTVLTHCISIIINIIIIVETQSHKFHKSPVPHTGSCFTFSKKILKLQISTYAFAPSKLNICKSHLRRC